MIRYQVQVPLGGLPVNLVLVGNREHGEVAFVKVAPFAGAVFDLTDDGQDVRAVFDTHKFALFHPTDVSLDEEFHYDMLYDYKNIPVMLQWLKDQKLEEPKTIFG